MKNSPLKYLASILYFCSVIVILSLPRENFMLITGLMTVAFAIYFVINKYIAESNFKWMLGLTVITHLSALFFLPELSNDYFRFLWDGKITLSGINPFDFRPDELTELTLSSPYLHELYNGMGDLSQGNYSCYPTLNQLYFMIPNLFSESIPVNVVIIKLLILITELAGGFYLFKLFRLKNIKTDYLWYIFLNPLWIIETIGNGHFEGVMMSFFIIAIYYLVRLQLLPSALLLGLAVQIKLLPLIFLPFLIRFIGLRKTVIYSFITLFTVTALGLTQLNSSNILHFMESLRLYFNVFEFNSFIQHYVLQAGEWLVGYNPIRFMGPVLSVITMLVILGFALFRKKPDYQVLLKDFVLALFIYLLLSNTLHPWYIIPLLVLYPFTQFLSILLWTFLITLSYSFYIDNSESLFVRILINAEYLLVIAFLVYDIITTRKNSNPSFSRVNDAEELDHNHVLPKDGRS